MYSSQCSMNLEVRLSVLAGENKHCMALCEYWPLLPLDLQVVIFLASGKFLIHMQWSVLSEILKGNFLQISEVFFPYNFFLSSTLSCKAQLLQSSQPLISFIRTQVICWALPGFPLPMFWLEIFKEANCGKSQRSSCLFPGLSDYCPLFPDVHLFYKLLCYIFYTVLVVLRRRRKIWFFTSSGLKAKSVVFF